MKKKFLLALTCMTMTATLFGCGGAQTAANKGNETVTIVWYPNESGGDLEEARDAIGEVIEKALGKKVEHKLTTDYAIAIETIANNKAALSFMGPQGYVEANKKNDKIKPLVVPSGKSGTLDDAVYYAWLAVNEEDAGVYKTGEVYSMDAIEGKKMAFVSNSSTSGFKVPSSSIVSYFGSKEAWKGLDQEGLMEGGKDKFFSEVIFGGSHQGSAVSLLTGKADVAAFCDTILCNYVDLVSGTYNDVGATYKVKDNAEEPFNTVVGETFTVIASTPVLNSPIVMNTAMLSEGEQQTLIEALTSEAVTSNEKIFIPKGTEGKGFFTKEADEQFLITTDEWFDPVRKLSE